MRFARFLALAVTLTGCIDEDRPSFDVSQDSTHPDNDPTPESTPIQCLGGAPLLSYKSAGGFFETGFEPVNMPYGHVSWFVSGRCETRSCETRTHSLAGSIKGGALTPEQLEMAKRLAQDPTLAKFDNQYYVTTQGTCEGAYVRVTNLRGSFACDCSCDPNFVKLPPALTTFLNELQRLRTQTAPQLAPIELDLGLMAINASSPLWSPTFDNVADEHWQTLKELPVDLETLSLLRPTQPIRSDDPAVNATLRRLLSEHQAWQRTRIHPSWMYLRDKQGNKVVLAVVELAERDLVPNL